MRSFALATALTLVAIPAFAEDLVFTLINNSSVTITEFYLTKHSANDWGDNLLADSTVDAGTQAEVSIADGETTCDYDMRFVADTGAIHEVNQNVCDLGTYTLTD